MTMGDDNESDFFANFEDDLFEIKESRDLSVRSIPVFVPRTYFPGNANDTTPIDEIKSNPKFYKYHADHLYYKGRYSEALLAYEELLEMYRENAVMSRNLRESIAWCLTRCGDREKAETAARELQSEASTVDQRVSSHYLLKAGVEGQSVDPSTFLRDLVPDLGAPAGDQAQAADTSHTDQHHSESEKRSSASEH